MLSLQFLFQEAHQSARYPPTPIGTVGPDIHHIGIADPIRQRPRLAMTRPSAQAKATAELFVKERASSSAVRPL
jgi:hypothetical protein